MNRIELRIVVRNTALSFLSANFAAMNYRPFLLAALSGILLGVSYPPFPLGPLVFVALLPAIYVFGVSGSLNASFFRLFTSAWLLGLFQHGISNWWISSFQEKTDPYLFWSGIVLDILHPVFLALPWITLGMLRRRYSARAVLWLVPFVFCCFEWLHGQSDASYPWLSVGYDLIMSGIWAQLADVVGIYGLGFLIAVTNVLVLSVMLRHSEGRPVKIIYGALAVLHITWLSYGIYSYSLDYSYPTSPVTVGIVQPNMDPWDKWSDASQQVVLHQGLVDSFRLAGGSADLYIWSETAIPFPIRLPAFYNSWLALMQWVDTTGPLLTGYADYYFYPASSHPPSARVTDELSPRYYDAFNAAMVLWPGAADSDIPVHRKGRLTPFAERLPFADQLTFAMNWFEWGVGISAWGKGQVFYPLLLPVPDTTHIGVIVCIESIYPEVCSKLSNNGAQFLTVITNDAWYNGTWGPRQHHLIAAMRAIETRRWVARCANSGISGVIDAAGITREELPAMSSGILAAEVARRTNTTFYAQYGDLAGIVSALVTLALAILAPFVTVRTHQS